MRRDEIESRVLNVLQTRFFQSGHFQTFCEEFTAAENEARMAHRANLSSAKRDLERVRSEIRQIIEVIKRGLADADFDEIKAEMIALKARKLDLLQRIETADELPPLLHRNMADVWRAQVTALRDTLAEDRSDPEAREVVRQMVQEIRLTPRDGVLAIDVKGNLAAMLSAASPSEDWPRRIALVAGGFEPPTFGL